MFGKSRQAYYQYKRSTLSQHDRDELILSVIRSVRSDAPRIGAYKLFCMVKEIFMGEAFMGRDRFFDFLRKHDLMLKRKRPRCTTNSNHMFRKHRNLIKDYIPTRPNTLWVSDITYIRTTGNFLYLHLVTDAYSRKIVGWKLSETLEAKHSVDALLGAIHQVKDVCFSNLIHHSDRGIQYCCGAYTSVLYNHGIQISMTEDYAPTDNAIAERVNGILKSEWLDSPSLPADISEANSRVEKAIHYYNNVRPHMSNQMKTPEEIHTGLIVSSQVWKERYLKQI